jgi:hypothetical protein
MSEQLTLKEYNQLQIEEMEKHKWIESEKAGHDLGDAAHMDWVIKYAAKFREEHPVTTDKLPTDKESMAENGLSEDFP